MITRSKARQKAKNLFPNLSENIPKEKSGLIQDKMFQNAILFRNEDDIILEGLSYQQIQNNQSKMNQLCRLRNNLPKYYSMSNRKKGQFFQDLNKDYMYNMQKDLSNTQNLQKKMQIISEDNKNLQKVSIIGNINNSKANNNKTRKVNFQSFQNFKIFKKEETPKQVRISQQQCYPLNN